MTESKPSIVLVMEKPIQLKWAASIFSEKWPDRRILAVLTYYLGVYEFRYPRGMKMADFPFVGEPSWKVRDFGYPMCMVFEIDNGQAVRTDLSFSDVIRDAGEVWFACDPDHSGANAFEVLMAECRGIDVSKQSFPAMFIRSLDNASLRKAIAAPATTDSQEFREWAAKGQAKRFFDFNFNTNSMAVFGDRLRKAGANTEEFDMGKNSLQLLYWMRAQQGAQAITEGKLLMLMESWKGTGRYEKCEMGSPASRGDIFKSLVHAGLLEQRDRDLEISDLGLEFLNLLHPDCEDPDLPARLREWQADWPNAKPKMARYIRTLFGKQLRFNY